MYDTVSAVAYNVEDALERLKDMEDSECDPIGDAEKIEIAQQLLQATIQICESVSRSRNDRHAKAYLIDHLHIFASKEHHFLSASFNMDEWIERIEEEDNEEE